MILLWRLALALYLSLIPVAALLPSGAGLGFHLNDKIAHAAAFLLLALLADRALPGRRYDWINVLSLFTLGLMIESLQYHTDYRSASLGDLAADATGLLAYGLLRRRKTP